jgi:hypothetical protein
MDREKFIELQGRATEAIFALTSGEEGARQRFQELAIDTYDVVTSMGGTILWGLNPSWGSTSDMASFYTREGTRIELPQSLVRRWEVWSGQYQDIYARSPRLRLYDMLHAISESHNASSWPSGYERRIADWVDAGDASAPPPFDDRYAIVTAEFFQELRALRHLCGGWFYSDDNYRTVFAPEVEWQRVRAAQEAVEAAWFIKRKEMLAVQESYLNRLPEILALARADKEFWQTLRKWELDQDLHRASLLPLQTISGPMRVVNGKRVDPPVDPMYRDFLARVLQPDDVLKPGNVASYIRMEVRRELGLHADIGFT